MAWCQYHPSSDKLLLAGFCSYVPSIYSAELGHSPSLIAAQTNGLTTEGLTDTFSNYHDYTVSFTDKRKIALNSLHTQIDWQSDTLTWLIDGNIVRTLKKSDTINSNGVALYPSTPARVQIRYNSLPHHLFRAKLTVMSLHQYVARRYPRSPSGHCSVGWRHDQLERP